MHKGGGAGCIQNIYLAAGPRGVGEGGGNRHLAFHFLRIRIRHGAAIINMTQAVDSTAGVEQ